MLGCSDEVLIELLNELPYNEKVQLYDSKCSKCPYKLIVVEDVEDKDGNSKEFQSIEEAIGVASTYGKSIGRFCAYPTNIRIKRTKEGEELIYPDVNDIVKNTCKFWKL